MSEKIYDIVDKYDDPDEAVGAIKEFLGNSNNIVQFLVNLDFDVFDSPGLYVYYIYCSWVDRDGILHSCGCPYYSE